MDYITLKEAAAMVGLTHSTLRKYAQTSADPHLKTVKKGRDHLTTPEWVIDWKQRYDERRGN
jgi:hypothetical protein